MEKFFLNLTNIINKHCPFLSHRIYNVDETEITTVQAIPKIISEKGKKQVVQIAAAERGSLVSVACTVNAAGGTIPPVTILPRVYYKGYMIKGAPDGTVGFTTQNGWMTSEIFLDVVNHIRRFTLASRENAILLMLDNHDSHLSFNVIELARENGIHIVTFPPHCSHKLQPQVATTGHSSVWPIKTAYKKGLNEWNISNRKRVTIYDLPTIFNKAYFSSFAMANIQTGFQKAGTFPVNSMIFPDSEFAASTVFIPHLTSEIDVQEVNEVNIPVNVNDESQKRSSNSDDLQNHVQVNQCLQKSEEAQPGSSKQHVSPSDIMSYPKLQVKERKNGEKRDMPEC